MSWIKVEHDLVTSPKFVTLASRLRHGRTTVLGACITLWMQADRHCVENCLQGMTLEALDALVELPGFGQAMVDVGWIRVHPDCLEVVDYQEHNGTTAKARAQSAKRSERYRHATVTQDRDDTVTKTKTKTEKKKKKKKKEEEPPPPPDQIDLTYPCDGSPEAWHLSKTQVARWAELYPKLDVLAECRKALAWVESNPANRKTSGRMAHFLNGWLGRASDKITATGNAGTPRQPYQKPPPPPLLKMSERLAMRQAEEARQTFNGPSLTVSPPRQRIGGEA